MVVETANYQLPPIAADKLMVNLGINYSGGGDDSAFDGAMDAAQHLVGDYSVCNDQVEFYDGLGHKKVLTTSSTGLCAKVDEPRCVPEATMTDAGVFDSDNYTKQGVQLIPDIWISPPTSTALGAATAFPFLHGLLRFDAWQPVFYFSLYRYDLWGAGCCFWQGIVV